MLCDVFSLRAFLTAASVLKSRAEKLSSKIYTSGFFTKALAIESLCFCPPDTLVPPCEISSAYFKALVFINSEAWAIFAASSNSSNNASSLPYFKLLSIVPENNIPFWGT